MKVYSTSRSSHTFSAHLRLFHLEAPAPLLGRHPPRRHRYCAGSNCRTAAATDFALGLWPTFLGVMPACLGHWDSVVYGPYGSVWCTRGFLDTCSCLEALLACLIFCQNEWEGVVGPHPSGTGDSQNTLVVQDRRSSSASSLEAWRMNDEEKACVFLRLAQGKHCKSLVSPLSCLILLANSLLVASNSFWICSWLIHQYDMIPYVDVNGRLVYEEQYDCKGMRWRFWGCPSRTLGGLGFSDVPCSLLQAVCTVHGAGKRLPKVSLCEQKLCSPEAGFFLKDHESSVRLDARKMGFAGETKLLTSVLLPASKQAPSNSRIKRSYWRLVEAATLDLQQLSVALLSRKLQSLLTPGDGRDVVDVGLG